MTKESQRVFGVDPCSRKSGFGIIDINNNKPSYVTSGVIKSLKGDCNSAISILSNLTFKKLFLTARIYSSDGKKMIESTHADQMNKSKEIGENIGKILIKKGGLRILKL